MTSIAVRALWKSFTGGAHGDVAVVKGVDLEVRSGEYFFVLGPSGCGKTTLLRIIAGLEQPNSGQVLFDGRDVTALPARERGVGFVFQSYALWPHLTVAENVSFGLALKGASAARCAHRCREVLELVRMEEYAARMPGELSGGQQQRVAIARAIAREPKVLLLDEPVSNLDARLREEVRHEMHRLQRTLGLTTIFVTHDREEVLAGGERACIMRGGSVVQIDTPRALYEQPRSAFVGQFMGDANFVRGVLRLAPHGWELHAEGDEPLVLGPRATSSLTEGATVTVMLRPESLQVRSDAAATFPLTVTQCVYVGAYSKLSAQSASGRTFELVVRDGCYRVQDDLKVAVAPESWVIVEDDR